MKLFGGRSNRNRKKTGEDYAVCPKPEAKDGAAALSPEAREQKQIRRRRRLAITLFVLAGAILAASLFIKWMVRPPSIDPFDDDDEWLQNGDDDGTQMEDGDALHISDKNRKEDFFVFLICATDEDETRTDALLVAAFDNANKKLSLLSVPRDTMSNVRRSGASKKINAAYNYGIEQTMKEVSQLVGLPIDNYMVVNFEGVAEIAETIGGVTFDVPRRMKYDDPTQNLHINLQPGLQELDGDQVVQLLRWRKNNGGAGYAEGDVGRIRTQQDFFMTLAQQMLQIKNIPKIKAIANSIFTHVKTDFTAGELAWLCVQGMKLSADEFRTDILPGYDQYVGGLSFYIPKKVDILSLINEVYSPYLGEITQINVVSASSFAVEPPVASGNDEETPPAEDTRGNAGVNDDPRDDGGGTGGGSTGSTGSGTGGGTDGGTDDEGDSDATDGSEGTGGEAPAPPPVDEDPEAA